VSFPSVHSKTTVLYLTLILLGSLCPYELCYTNILTILDLASIPLRSSDRGEEMPIILGGGSCSLNPEPVADFFDAILLGDGEEAILEIAESVRISREAQLPRATILEKLATIPGVYIPSHFKPSYNEDGSIAEIKTLKPDFLKSHVEFLAIFLKLIISFIPWYPILQLSMTD